MTFRIQKGLVVILPMNICKSLAELIQVGKGDQLVIDFACTFSGTVNLSCDDKFITFIIDYNLDYRLIPASPNKRVICSGSQGNAYGFNDY